MRFTGIWQPHPMRRRWPRMLSIIISVLAVSGTLAACEGQIPQPLAAQETSSDSTTSPDLTQGQEKRMRERILKAVRTATDAKSTNGLDQSMSGPALQIRSSQIAIARSTGTLDPRTTIPTDVAQTVIPTQSGWPRTVFTITTTTQDQQSKRLLVLEQEKATSNYRLWAVARLFPGAELPKFEVASIGSQMGEPDDSGLKLTPVQAVQQYADVLQNGSSSRYASVFADDHFRQTLDELTATVQEGMERNNGTQHQTFSVPKDQIAVVRSADGGDLVVAQINSQWVRQAGEGRQSLPASDSERALFGKTAATSIIKVGYVNVIAMYIPPAGSTQQITAVGAEQQPVSVKAG